MTVPERTPLPRSLVADSDYTMIRAELVRTLDGDAVAAIVLTRVAWRCDGPHAVEGWWTGGYDTLADETGLSGDQVRKAVGRLKTAGLVETSKRRAGGSWDHTLSYRAVLDGPAETIRPRSHIETASGPDVDSAQEPEEDPAQEPELPLETLETFETRASDEESKGKGKPYRFEEVWALYPSRRGRRVNRAQALKGWTAMSYVDKAACFRAVQTFAAESPELPPDLFRWIRNGTWRDYLTPCDSHSVRRQQGPKTDEQRLQEEFVDRQRQLAEGTLKTW